MLDLQNPPCLWPFCAAPQRQGFDHQMPQGPSEGFLEEIKELISHGSGTLMPPQEWSDRNSTGLVTPGSAGYLSRKSSSAGSISLFIRRICNSKQTSYPRAARIQSSNKLQQINYSINVLEKCVAKMDRVPCVGRGVMDTPGRCSECPKRAPGMSVEEKSWENHVVKRFPGGWRTP